MATKKPVFIGFSTYEATRPPYSLVDIELVKRDLLNHFHTRVGERVMLPEFGCGIHDLLYEPFDDTTKSQVEEEVVNVIESDPRVELSSININFTDHTIEVDVVLEYIQFSTADQLSIVFDRNNEDVS